MPKICEFNACRKRATYGLIFGVPVRCGSHKLAEHKSQYTVCKCGKGCPLYNVVGERAMYCGKCRDPATMINLVSKLCEHERCKKNAGFLVVGETVPRFCRTHATPDMVSKSKKCETSGCTKHASFNHIGESVGKFCKTHALPEMVIVHKRVCEHPGGECKKVPHFDFPNRKRPRFCFTHKQEGMEDIVHPTCIFAGCMRKQPSYNFIGQKPLYCAEHMKPGMIDVKSRRCDVLNCMTFPSFNFMGKRSGVRCCAHKLEGMVNVVSKQCQMEDCKHAAIYNIAGEPAMFCRKHKSDNMVNVHSTLCEHHGCTKTPSFNFATEQKARFCESHSQSGMINIVSKKCEHAECLRQPLYNLPTESAPRFCGMHRTDGMVDVVNPRCKANHCMGAFSSAKYKGYCSSCYQHEFPTDPLTYQIRSKTKEIAVRDFINGRFEGFSHDEALWTGNCDCTHRRRIDHRTLIGNTLLCVETDENQHKRYDKNDETYRYDDLAMIHGGKFVFIRFNPDKYCNSSGRSINPYLYSRLPTLEDEIRHQIERIKAGENEDLVEIVHLFYDEQK